MFPGGKGGRCVGLTTHVQNVLKSGSLNLLEPSGPVQACNGITFYWVRKWGTLLVAQLVEAPRYKPEGRGFDSRWCHWN